MRNRFCKDFGDIEFSEVLKKTGAVLSGSWPLQVILRQHWLSWVIEYPFVWPDGRTGIWTSTLCAQTD
jgi:hypothetical protein